MTGLINEPPGVPNTFAPPVLVIPVALAVTESSQEGMIAPLLSCTVNPTSMVPFLSYSSANGVVMPAVMVTVVDGGASPLKSTYSELRLGVTVYLPAGWPPKRAQPLESVEPLNEPGPLPLKPAPETGVPAALLT